MSALAALQDKNSTLEKNLSAETRVKLDLFSALGDAKRQLEVDKSKCTNESTLVNVKISIKIFFFNRLDVRQRQRDLRFTCKNRTTVSCDAVK